MTGRVCPKHEEYCPDGVCRWCEPAPRALLEDLPYDPTKTPIGKPLTYMGIRIFADPMLGPNEFVMRGKS